MFWRLFQRDIDQTSPFLSRRDWWVILLALLVSLGIGLAAPRFIGLVIFWDNGLNPYPGRDLPQDYALGVLWAVVLGLSILAWPVGSRDKLAVLVIWLIKSVIVLGLMLPYEYVYGVDPDGYYTNAVVNQFVWEGFDIANGTKNIQHLAWLQDQIVPGSFHASKASFAYMGLVAIYLFYRAGLIATGSTDRRILLYGLALCPSILFWSSVLGKDPVVCFGIALYTYGIVGWYRFHRFRYLLALGLGVSVAILVRVFLGPILIIPLCVFALYDNRRLISRLTVAAVALVALGYSLILLSDVWNIASGNDVLGFIHYVSRGFESGGSSLQPKNFSSYSEVVTFLPLGIFTVLFRPLPGDVLNAFGLIAGLENVLLLVLLWRAVQRTSWSEMKEPIVIWALMLIGAWASLSSVGLYQNLGTLVRHKLEILPILLGLLLYLGRLRPALRVGVSAHTALTPALA